MAQFDPVLWRKRAWDRLRRAARKEGGKPTSAQESSWAADWSAITDLEKVVDWCKIRCISVVFDRVEPGTAGVFDSGTNVITISSRYSAQKQLITLLHECGHYLLGDKANDDRFKMGYAMHHDEAVTKTFAHKIACVEEEFEAWHRGWRLSRRLGLSLSREAFDDLRLACLKSYIKWSARKGQ